MDYAMTHYDNGFTQIAYGVWADEVLTESIPSAPEDLPAYVDAVISRCIRRERDKALGLTDYLMMPDYPLLEEHRAAWAVYRQALRDVPEQQGFPADVQWPTRPAE